MALVVLQAVPLLVEAGVQVVVAVAAQEVVEVVVVASATVVVQLLVGLVVIRAALHHVAAVALENAHLLVKVGVLQDVLLNAPHVLEHVQADVHLVQADVLQHVPLLAVEVVQAHAQ